MSPILTAHVADDLVAEVVLSVPAELQVTLEPLDVRLQLDGQRERVLARVLFPFLVSITTLPARVTSSANRFRVGTINFVVFSQTRLVKVIISLTVGQSRCRAVTGISGKRKMNVKLPQTSKQLSFPTCGAPSTPSLRMTRWKD